MEDFEPGEGWSGPYLGLDFGFAQDPTALVKLWVHERVLYVERELYRVGLELDHTTDSAKLAVPGCEVYTIRADSSRPESISYLRRHGLERVVSVKKWSGSVEDGIAHLRQYEAIVIHSRCRNFVAECRSYSYKVDERSGDVLPVILDKANHLIDAARYALEPMIKRRTMLGPWWPGKDRKSA